MSDILPLPCPFCKSEDITYQPNDHYSPTAAYMECGQCDCRGPLSAEDGESFEQRLETALRLWNQR